MLENEKNKQENILLDSIGSSFPGSGSSSNTDYKQISNIITSNKRILVKIIPPLIIGWLIIFVLQIIQYLTFGPSDCSGNLGPFIPSFFCEGDNQPWITASFRFLFLTFSFILVVEVLLLFFWWAGKFAKTKYNFVISKPVTYLFGLFIIGIILLLIWLALFK